jgi:hypothetical protein
MCKLKRGGWLLFFGGAKLELPYILLRKIKKKKKNLGVGVGGGGGGKEQRSSAPVHRYGFTARGKIIGQT